MRRNYFVTQYRKIPKIIPGGYVFQDRFLRGLFWRSFSKRWEICVTKSIGLAYNSEANKKFVTLPFLLCFILYLRAISKYKSWGLKFGGEI